MFFSNADSEPMLPGLESREIHVSLLSADTGRGLLPGFGIAFIGITADRLTGAWAKRRKMELGIA